MRNKTLTKQVKLSKEAHKRCLEDKDNFQKTLGGGKWSISDTIEKYQRIVDELKNGKR